MRAPGLEQAIGVVSNKAPVCHPISPEKHKWLKMFYFAGTTRKLSGIGRRDIATHRSLGVGGRCTAPGAIA
jgi:hypothetical protein